MAFAFNVSEHHVVFGSRPTKHFSHPPRVISKEETMKEWIAVLQAADRAAKWHVQQQRKGAAQEPYINHLIEVAMLVAQATDGNDANLVIAAFLHDAVE